MKTLAAMIRKQKITINVQKQELHTLLQHCAESEENLKYWCALCRETKEYLWLQLATGHEISLDQLYLARIRHSEHEDNCAEAERKFDLLSAEVENKKKDIGYAEKAMEKFVELLMQRKREARGVIQLSEWQALDEWAINIGKHA